MLILILCSLSVSIDLALSKVVTSFSVTIPLTLVDSEVSAHDSLKSSAALAVKNVVLLVALTIGQSVHDRRVKSVIRHLSNLASCSLRAFAAADYAVKYAVLLSSYEVTCRITAVVVCIRLKSKSLHEHLDNFLVLNRVIRSERTVAVTVYDFLVSSHCYVTGSPVARSYVREDRVGLSNCSRVA